MICSLTQFVLIIRFGMGLGENGFHRSIVKIIIVDDHALLRLALKSFLEKDGSIAVIAEASTKDEAFEYIKVEQPDLVTVDISLEKDFSGIDLIESIKAESWPVKSIVISVHESAKYVLSSFRAGASAYVCKNRAELHIKKALNSVLQGEIYIDERFPKEIRSLVQNKHFVQQDPLAVLSMRELRFFVLLGKGCSMKEIAALMNATSYAVESYKRQIKEKLMLQSSAELYAHAIKWFTRLNA